MKKKCIYSFIIVLAIEADLNGAALNGDKNSRDGTWLLPENVVSRVKLEQSLIQAGLASVPSVRHALALLPQIYGKQKRRNGTGVIDGHINPVVTEYIRYGRQAHLSNLANGVVVLMLHDGPEDNSCFPLSYFYTQFGHEIADQLRVLTKYPLEHYAGMEREEAKLCQDLDQIEMIRNSPYPELPLYKAIDRLLNLSHDLAYSPSTKRSAAYALRSRAYLPLFEKTVPYYYLKITRIIEKILTYNSSNSASPPSLQKTTPERS